MQSYTNGTAIAIRLLVGNGWGVGVDENAIEGVSIFPNPTEGIITITNNNNDQNTIVVYDVIGKVVSTQVVNNATTIDLSSNGTGIYLVEVSNSNGKTVERVVVK